mgnify:CR=1 FL=1
MRKYYKGWVDAGHGGHDPGAVGPGGTKESNVALNVSNMVYEHLGLAGVTMGFTRDIDTFESLSARSNAANSFDADFFISIHCNSAKVPAEGIETFAMRGSKEGLRFAGFIQDSLLDEFEDAIDRGVKEAGFSVLRKTRMVAILIELEFIHTVSGEAKLSDPAVQERCARAIANGVLRYLDMPVLLKPDVPALVDDGNSSVGKTKATVEEVRLRARLSKAKKLAKQLTELLADD